MTIKVGFPEHQLDSDMIMCSATVALQCAPQVLFTKDVFLEIPHSYSSTDTDDLWFIKFKDGMGYGEIHRGVFPPEHPYGVIMFKSFSSYACRLSPWKMRIYWPKRRTFCKLKQKEIVYKHDLDGQVHHPSSNLFWLCIGKTSETDNNFQFAVAQYTPTGLQVSLV